MYLGTTNQSKTAMYVALFGGLRRAELCGINEEDVDFENSSITVKRNRLQNSRDGLYEDTPKTVKSVRTIVLPEAVMNKIRLLLEYQAREKIRLDGYWKNSPALFKRADGSTQSPQGFYRWLVAFEKRHGLRHLPLHGLRHTHTSMLADNKDLSIAEISRRLGHSQQTTTINIYTHLFKETDRQAAEILQKNFFKKPTADVAKNVAHEKIKP